MGRAQYTAASCVAVVSAAVLVGAFTDALTEIYGGRKLATGWPSYKATINGSTAQVVFKYNDLEEV
ncbi:hypothetical protein GPX89_05785 [Nocardia sp. ET3-3]|uniref:Uncharacterized protein n=1 Tax=Nocardia terrae TaxID=2675851 RepID=A0A7K1UR27_9NOCA|nr:hypothetical protein [Nocardia terrae]MVU76757.1 hypothetical protein [Nocardia terrae]